MGKTLVSIIMPCYNSSRFIAECIESVQNQTYKDWELLIVDDCSSDNSIEIIKRYAKQDKRIKLLTKSQNSGAGVARNLAIKRAQGTYLAFIDSDDWWYSDKLELQLAFMQDNSYEFTYTDYEDCDENLNVLHTFRQKRRISFNDLCVECSIGTPGVVLYITRIGKIYMPETRRSEDWGLWLKVIEQTGFAYSLAQPLWKYRHNAGSTSSSKLAALKDVFSMYRNVVHFSLIKSWYYLLMKMLPRYIIKRFINRY